MQERTRDCPGSECVSEDGENGLEVRDCDTEVLCSGLPDSGTSFKKVIESSKQIINLLLIGKMLIIGGTIVSSPSTDVPSEILDVRAGSKCEGPSYSTYLGNGVCGTLLWNRYPVTAGGDSLKDVIYVFKPDGTYDDIIVEGGGRSRRYAAALTLADKEHLYIVGGYYSDTTTISDTTEVIHLNAEGTEATGGHGPDIPAKLVYPCFTDFVDTDGNRKFFLFGGNTQSASQTASDQQTGFNTKGWVLAESDFDPEGDDSWDNAVETPEFTDFTMIFITCKAFKNSDGEEEIMIIGGTDEDYSTIYNPSDNAFRTGPRINLKDDDYSVQSLYKASLFASTTQENELILSGGYLEYDNSTSLSTFTETYSEYIFKLTCPDDETDAANCPFEQQDIKLEDGRSSHISYHVPDTFADC